MPGIKMRARRLSVAGITVVLLSLILSPVVSIGKDRGTAYNRPAAGPKP
jgi:hypothetical protein